MLKVSTFVYRTLNRERVIATCEDRVKEKKNIKIIDLILFIVIFSLIIWVW